MAVIGNSSTQQAFTPAIDYFSGTGSATAFTLSRPVASVAQVQVTIDNVAQNPSSAYTVSANTITFTSAPLSGTNNIYVYYTSPITDVIAPGQGTVTTTSLTSSLTLASPNITTALTLTGAAGTSGQALTSGGSGVAPTWTTIGASTATATTLGTVYGRQTTSGGTPYLTAYGYNAGTNNTGANNTAVGVDALAANTSAAKNTAVGHLALTATTTGGENVGVGYGALYSNNGTQNVAIGNQTLQAVTTATANTAVGYQAGYANSIGDANAFVGHSAGKAVTSGSYNALFGAYAGQSVTTGARNCLIGEAAGSSVTTANYSTLVGDNAGNSITSGSSNVCVGREAGSTITTGSANIVIGPQAGNVSTGSNNVYIGASTASGGSTNGEGVIACGVTGTTGKGANTFYIQPNGGGVYQGNNSAAWSVASDQRLKKNIVDNTEGLNIVSQIRVRNFEYRLPEEVTELEQHSAIEKTGVQLGVIAQELEQVCPDCIKTESTGVMSVNSDNVFWHIVNAIKELKALNDTQAETINALTARIEALENK